MCPIQRGRDRVKVKTICLEAVKIQGNKPKKLPIKIKKNKVTEIKVIPGQQRFPKIILNSKCNKFVKRTKKKVHLDLVIQKNEGVKRIKILTESQLREK